MAYPYIGNSSSLKNFKPLPQDMPDDGLGVFGPVQDNCISEIISNKKPVNGILRLFPQIRKNI